MSRAAIILSTNADRQRASAWVGKAPWGTTVTFQTSKRSPAQNSRMWAMLSDVALQAEHMGQRYSADQWKAIFMHACGHKIGFIPSLDGSSFIPWSSRSSELSKQEMSKLIEFIESWGARHGVTFHGSDKLSQTKRAA